MHVPRIAAPIYTEEKAFFDTPTQKRAAYTALTRNVSHARS